MNILHKTLLYTLGLLLASSLSWANPSLIPAPPQLAAKSWILMDANSGMVITEHNADEAMHPASLVKLMTSYVLAYWLDQGLIDYDDMVTVSQNAWAQNPVFRGSSLMWIEVGRQVSVRDLHKGIVVSSGNDACVAIAEHIAGTEDAFVDIMNRHALQMGLTNTFFTNSHGLTDDNQLTSARDMAMLSQAIISHPDAYRLHSMREFTYNNIRQTNRNRLLWRDPSVDGLKTGHTESAGYNLVTSAKRDGMRLISVVMGANSEAARERETQRLLTYGFRYYETHPLFTGGVELIRTRVWKGASEEVGLGVEGDIFQTIPRGMHDQLEASLNVDQFVTAPVASGSVLGELVVTLGEDELMRTPLVALEEVEAGGLFKRLWDSLVLFVLGFFR